MTWGEWMTGLRHEANAPPHFSRGASEVHPGDRGVAAVRAKQSGEHPQGGGLPGTVGTEEAEDLALLHGEVHAAYGIDRGCLAAALGPE